MMTRCQSYRFRLTDRPVRLSASTLPTILRVHVVYAKLSCLHELSSVKLNPASVSIEQGSSATYCTFNQEHALNAADRTFIDPSYSQLDPCHLSVMSYYLRAALYGACRICLVS